MRLPASLHIKIIHWVLAATLLITGLFVGAVKTQAAETTKLLYGTVYTAQGTPVPDVTVYATAPGDTVALYTPVTTASDGTYSFSVAYKSTYDIHFEPAAASNLQNHVEPNFYLHRTDAQVDAYLPSSIDRTYSGTILDDNDDPVEGITVKASNTASGEQTATSDSNGAFSMQLSGDVYNVSLAKDGAGSTAAYPNFELAQDAIDLTADDAVATYHLPAVGVATVTAYDRTSSEAAGQSVSFTGDNAQTYETTTNAQGVAYVPFLRASGIAESAICVTFQQTEAVVCNPTAYDGTEDVALDMYEPAGMTLTGTITDSESNPVADIHVILTSQTDSTVYDVVSESDGTYMLTVDPGEYSAVVSTRDSSYLTKKYWSVFALDQGILDLSADQTLDVALPVLHTLHIDVTGHNNTTLRVDADPNDGYVQTAFNNTGSVDFVTYEGQELPVGSICATYEASNAGTVCNTEPITVGSENVTYAFVAPEMYIFSGQILNVDGTPAKNRSARLLLNSTVTATAVGKNAAFSISLTPGTYTVHALATGGIDEDMGTVDIVDAAVSQNYQFSQ